MSALAASAALPRASLLQFHVTEDKAVNLKTARSKIEESLSGVGGGEKPKLLVLPEVWNSPYATSAFTEYAEELPSVEKGEDMRGSESAKMLSEAAKEFEVFIVGGSVPEREVRTSTSRSEATSIKKLSKHSKPTLLYARRRGRTFTTHAWSSIRLGFWLRSTGR